MCVGAWSLCFHLPVKACNSRFLEVDLLHIASKLTSELFSFQFYPGKFCLCFIRPAFSCCQVAFHQCALLRLQAGNNFLQAAFGRDVALVVSLKLVLVKDYPAEVLLDISELAELSLDSLQLRQGGP